MDPVTKHVLDRAVIESATGAVYLRHLLELSRNEHNSENVDSAMQVVGEAQKQYAESLHTALKVLFPPQQQNPQEGQDGQDVHES